MSWFFVLAAASWLSPTAGARWFNIGIAFLVLGLFEANAWRKPDFHMEGDYSLGYSAPDEVLGYGPARSGPVPTQKYFGDELVYDVVYTYDENRLRVAPPARPDADQCVLFFGGSFTLGEGVGDHETLPWRVGVLSGGRARVYNFGFHGYGPHQMLAALQSGRVSDAIGCTPTHVVYQAIADHINRAVGMSPWDRNGPRYVVGEDGAALRQGRFDDEVGIAMRFVRAQLEKSLIYKRVSHRRRAVSADDLERFHAIVDAANRETQRRWPGAAFHAIVWDQEGEPPPNFCEGLEARGIVVHRMSRMLPARVVGDPRLELSPFDRHPNTILYDAMARYVVRRILAEPDL